MKKYVFLFCMSLILFSVTGKAQDSIGMGYSKPIGLRDTVQASSLDSFTVVLKNFRSTTFNDTVTLKITVRDTTNSNILHPLGSYTTYNAVLLPAYDSVVIPLTAVYNLSGSGYHPGINVIVIWPVAQSAITVDSLAFSVFIIDATGINEIDLRQFIKAFPNPVKDHLTIENSSNIGIEEVRIFDASGRLTMRIKNQSVINTENWPAGEYMVELLLNNKQRHPIRIIKQK